MFTRQEKTQIASGIGLILIALLLSIPQIIPHVAKLLLSQRSPVGNHNLSGFEAYVIDEESIFAVSMNNPPRNRKITVKLGEYGTQGLGGIVVGSFYTEEQETIEKFFPIPDELRTREKIAVRIEAGINSYAYSWFRNRDSGGGIPPTSAYIPTPFGFSITAKVENDPIFVIGQSGLVRLSMNLITSGLPKEVVSQIPQLCFQANVVSPSFDITPSTPECVSTFTDTVIWEWNIRPKSDASVTLVQGLIFEVFVKSIHNNLIRIYSSFEEVEVKPQNFVGQIQQTKLEIMLPILIAFLGLFLTAMPVIGKLFRKSSGEDKLKDYLISVSLEDQLTIEAVLHDATETQLMEAISIFPTLISEARKKISRNRKGYIKSIGYLYHPSIQKWEFNFLKLNGSGRIVKNKDFYEPSHPVELVYRDTKE